MKKPLMPSYVRTALLYFLAIELFCLLGRSLLTYYLTEDGMGGTMDVSLNVRLYYRCLQLLVVTAVVVYLGKSLGLSWHFKNIRWQQVAVLLGVLALFLFNNILASVYSSNAIAANQEIYTHLGLYCMTMTFSSTWEELLYRGVIQSYIDERHPSETVEQGFYVTYGNKWASSVFIARHLGFFIIFDPFFAVTGLLLVALLSVTAGWIRSETGSLVLPIIFHCVCNYIYLSAHAFFAFAG